MLVPVSKKQKERMKAESKSKGQLAKEYKVHYNTFIKWVKKIPDLDVSPQKRVLTPKPSRYSRY